MATGLFAAPGPRAHLLPRSERRPRCRGIRDHSCRGPDAYYTVHDQNGDAWSAQAKFVRRRSCCAPATVWMTWVQA